MVSRRITTRSPAQTRRLGRRAGECALPGDIIFLQGPLGVGKTVFVQGVAEALGVPQPATSPSFVLVHEYRGRLPVYHVDLYRLESAQAADLALEQYFDGGGLTIVEWAERLPDSAPFDSLRVRIEWAPQPNSRRLTISAGGERGSRLLRSLVGPGIAVSR